MKKVLCLLFLLSVAGFAKTHEIKMLNKGSDGEKMVFEPAFLKVEVGDTVKFIPTDKGHSVQGIAKKGAMPDGFKPWKGKLNKEEVVQITKEGVYLYKCQPHVGMGMVGIIQAGKAVNLEKAKKVKLTGKAKKRMEKLLTQVK